MACFAAVIRCDGMNYNTKSAYVKASFAMSYCSVGFMFCKLLILKDKLRVALEWIHSKAEAAGIADSPGLSMPGNSIEVEKQIGVQGSSSEDPAAAEPHKVRENQSSTALHA